MPDEFGPQAPLEPEEFGQQEAEAESLDDPRKEDREDHDRDDEGLEPSLPIPEGRLQGQDGRHRRRQEGQEDGLEERVHQAPRVDHLVIPAEAESGVHAHDAGRLEGDRDEQQRGHQDVQDEETDEQLPDEIPVRCEKHLELTTPDG